uniref:NADH-ubiquinone oxidoreductase chain 5 n=1 Tax=Ledra trigona TaxID=2901394 RepID=A0A8K2ATY0_9HEMI|nr:NADH dehydrogenase subunit 5 [Ledra trigona]
MKNMNMFNWWSMTFFFSSMVMMILSMKMLLFKKTIMMEWEMMKINSSEMYFTILIDWMSLMFMSTVMMISSMILLYSSNYMGSNKNEQKRFYILMNLFILSMMLMIMSPNLISIMLGWDGLGLVSYCLVIFYSSKKSYNAGMITCMTNRLGDIGILISISWMMSYGSWHFIFYKEMMKEEMIYMLILSCFTKSAQMPFYSWLPEAMSAPTPISALVHSSTLVTAGVYLAMRFLSKTNMNYLLMMSIFTTMMASMCANYEFDLKKIIALSTLSQLGMMMSSIFLGMKEMSFLHLLTHATFKSLLFMCAGIMIFFNNNNQDIRNLSMINKTLPMTSSCFSISTLALCGMPFMSGFYSKDTIMENMSSNSTNMLSFLMMYTSLGLTMTYSTRTIYFLMMKQSKTKMKMKIKKIEKMKNSMIILAILSVSLGSLLMWTMNLNMKLPIITEKIKNYPIFMILMGMWMGVESFSFKKYIMSKSIQSMNSKMWNMTSLMFKWQKNTFTISFKFKKLLNNEWGEFYGASGTSTMLFLMSKNMMLSKNKTFLMSILIWMMMLM